MIALHVADPLRYDADRADRAPPPSDRTGRVSGDTNGSHARLSYDFGTPIYPRRACCPIDRWDGGTSKSRISR